MTGARPHGRVGRRGQRRGARGHEPQPGGRFLVERGLGEQAYVVGGHCHQHGAARHQRDRIRSVEPLRQQHAGAAGQRAVQCDEEAVRVVQRQHVQDGVRCGEAPGIDKRPCVVRQVAVGQQRTLGPPGRAGRVEQRGRVAGPAGDVLPVRPGAGLDVELAHVAHDERRLGVGDHVADLVVGRTRVHRKVHRPGAQAGQVQRHRFRRLREQDGDPVAGTNAGRDQRGSHCGRADVQVAVRDRLPEHARRAGRRGPPPRRRPRGARGTGRAQSRS